MKYTAKTDIGKLREANEDAFLADGGIFAVADGMGGHRAGEVASSLALKVFKKSFCQIKEGESETDIKRRLREGIEQANQAVFQRGTSRRDLMGMGTTLTATLPLDDQIHLVHVGDSRAYLIQKNKITQLTADHTLVGEMVRRGEISPELARLHPLKNILTRALGTDPHIQADLISRKIQKKDRLLLCTDGLSSMVEDKEILKIVNNARNLEKACQDLIEAANQGGGEDNITVILIEF